jgi:DNA polymerase I-like protein with 3'-5' exonuclease and polymerase domains
VFSISEEERGHAIRSAFNFKIQSVASDINLLAGIDAHNWIQDNSFPAEIFALVHDSIVGAVHPDYINEFQVTLKKFTQKDRGCSIPDFPIGVDFGFGKDYAEASAE